MEKNIYEGSCKLIPSLEKAILVHEHKEPGLTAEGVDVVIKYLGEVVIKYEKYEDVGKTVNPLAPLTAEDLKYSGLMRITLYAQDNQALGEVEQIILKEIEGK